jgi:3-oxoacyl-(acyl-carrier-protein) synthase/fatty-acid desaturase/acyl carrier protein
MKRTKASKSGFSDPAAGLEKSKTKTSPSSSQTVGPPMQASSGRRPSATDLDEALTSMVNQLKTSQRGAWKMLFKAYAFFGVGMVLAYSQWTPWFLIPFGILIEGVAFAWLHLIGMDCTNKQFFEDEKLNDIGAKVLRWEWFALLSVTLTFFDFWSMGSFLKFAVLPLIVVQATFASQRKSRRMDVSEVRTGGMKRSSSATTIFPELNDAASQIGELLETARRADGSVIQRRSDSTEHEWQFGIALHQVPMYHLNSLSKSMTTELKSLRTVGKQQPKQFSAPRSRDSEQRSERPRSKQSAETTPLDRMVNIVGVPARFLFREMWLWETRDIVFYFIVAMYLMQVHVAFRYFIFAPTALIFPILASSSGSAVLRDLQQELGNHYIPEDHALSVAKDINLSAVAQAIACHTSFVWWITMLMFGGEDPIFGGVIKWQTYVFAFALLVLSMVGTILGADLLWACRAFQAPLPQRVGLMICNSLANQGAVFRWAREFRLHLMNKGTDFDPFGEGLYSYIGWFLCHKPAHIVEKLQTVDVVDLYKEQILMFQRDVDPWWNLSICYAMPAFISLSWNETLWLGFLVAGAVRWVVSLHCTLLLVKYQHKWGPTTLQDAPQSAPPSPGLEPHAAPPVTGGFLRSGSLLAPPSVSLEQAALAAESQQKSSPGRPDPLEMPKGLGDDDEGGIIMKYNIRDAGTGQQAVEVKFEPLWKRSTLVDLVTDAVADICKIAPSKINPNKPLMDLGFDSVGALKLQDKLSRSLNQELPPTLLFDYPTIHAMVDFGLSQVSKKALTPKLEEFDAMGEDEKKDTPGDVPLVMVSASCDLPGADSLEAYWEELRGGKDAITEIPLARWDTSEHFNVDPAVENTYYVRHGGFIEDADLFDPNLFGVSAAEIKATDPQQRLVLTQAHHSCRLNGWDKQYLQDKDIGVFVAMSNLDWYQLNTSKVSVYTGTGVASAIASNRLSYCFGLKGPSMTLDTACSSSISALNAAAMHLRVTKLDSAIVAATEVIHGPMSLILRCTARMLSTDGRCKTFDASANGYIRAEGAGSMVLRRRPDAEEERETLKNMIHGVALNQDGKSSTLTAPNGPAQQQVVKMALRDAKLSAKAIAAVECHGTGTALGDPIEVSALKVVLGEPVKFSNPLTGAQTSKALILAAGKSNHGHLEGAAGFAGIMKSVLCTAHGEVPPNVHYQKLNPHISLEGSRLMVAHEKPKAIVGKEPIMGVSSFGFGGTNSHAVLGWVPSRNTTIGRSQRCIPLHWPGIPIYWDGTETVPIR